MGGKLSTMHTLSSVVNEKMIKRTIERIPEPELVMNDPENVKAYFEGSAINQQAIYAFILVNLFGLIRDGDRVLDLGCGSGNMLTLAAHTFKHAHFVGLDLSDNMLQYSKENVEKMNLTNVELVKGDMSKLSQMFDVGSFDVVISSAALHHLPNEEILRAVFKEIPKVLKRDGRVHITDFVLLKHLSSINTASNHNLHLQNDLFHEDYFNSLFAAFKRETYECIVKESELKVELFTMRVVPIFMCIKSPAIISALSEESTQIVRQTIESMHPDIKKDFIQIQRGFKYGGLKQNISQ